MNTDRERMEPPGSEGIRSFIAIELPGDARHGLARLRRDLERDEHRFVRWVDPTGIHLTLKFLGDIPSARVAEITAAMGAAVRGISSLRLEVSGLGAFPNLSRPSVLWVGVGGDVDQLARLQQGIDSALGPLGFAREERPFVPHLTLARLRQGALPMERRKFGELVTSTGFSGKYHFQAEAISLMRSRLTPSGAMYSRLSLVELSDGQALNQA